MIRPHFTLDLHHELIIDNFAGGGGASTGIELALGRNVDHAINHDLHALGMHRINHPQTVHHCEDVFDIDPRAVTEGRPVGLAHFSPDCKHFSKAKGGKPLDKRIRGLVLVMLRWAMAVAPRVMTMENVEEITTWGPLKWMEKNGKWGWHPDPDHKGRTWLAFLACLSTGIDPQHADLPEILSVLCGDECDEGLSQADVVRILAAKAHTAAVLIKGLGYQYEAREIRACDHGTPTIRKRLFMIARRDGRSVVWPTPTHFDASKKLPKGGKRWLPIADCLDWSLPCPSIFLTREEARVWKCKRPLVDSTLRRIATGIDRYVLKAKRPFLVSLTHQGGERVEDIDQPSRTITGAHRGEKAVVNPVIVNSANSKTTGRGPNTWPVDEPIRTVTGSPSFNQVEASLAPFLTEHANASTQRTFAADEPMRTQCGEVKGGHFAVVTGTVVGAGGPSYSGKPKPLDTPSNAQTTENHSAIAAATLVQTGYGEREGQAPRALDPEKPLGTIVAGAGKHAAVTGTLVHVAHGEKDKNGKKRGRGAKDLLEPSPAVLGSPDGALAAASMVKLRGDNVGDSADAPMHTQSAGGTHHGVVAATLMRQFGNSVGQEVDSAGPTVMAGGGGKTGLIAAHMTKFNTGAVGSHPQDPIATIPAGSHSPETHGGAATPHGMVAASLVIYNGSEKDGQPASDPAHTVTSTDRLAHVESSLTHCLTPEQIDGAVRVAAFLRSFGVHIEGNFATVTVDGQQWIIVDIGMRMLTPRELFRAQGFPETYVIDQAWLIDPKSGAIQEVTLTKEQQIRMCGNSVCPPVMAALVAANVPELATWYKGERSLKHALKI